MMKSLLILEVKKMLKQTKTKIILILSIALVLVFLFANHSMEQMFKESELENLKLYIDEKNDIVKEIQGFTNLSDEQKEEAIRTELYEKKLLEKQLELLEENNNKEFIEIQIELDQRFLDGILDGTLVGGEPIEYVEDRINLNESILQKDIEPVNELYSTKGFIFLKNTITVFFSYTGIALVLFLIGDILSREIERNTIKLLFTQAIPRINILNSKFFISIMSSILLLLTIVFTSFISGSLLSGTGSIHYPIPQYTNPMKFISIFEYLLQSSFLFIFVIIYIISLVLFLSVFSNNSITSIGLTIVIIGFWSFAITNFNLLSNVSHLVPFTYIKTPEIIDGSLAITLSNKSINLLNGILITSIFTILNYLLTVYLINKKEVFN